jgi:peroxiredoxin
LKIIKLENFHIFKLTFSEEIILGEHLNENFEKSKNKKQEVKQNPGVKKIVIITPSVDTNYIQQLHSKER